MIQKLQNKLLNWRIDAESTEQQPQPFSTLNNFKPDTSAPRGASPNDGTEQPQVTATTDAARDDAKDCYSRTRVRRVLSKWSFVDGKTLGKPDEGRESLGPLLFRHAQLGV